MSERWGFKSENIYSSNELMSGRKTKDVIKKNIDINPQIILDEEADNIKLLKFEFKNKI